MMAHSLSQFQLPKSGEFPNIFTGYEFILNEYERNYSEIDDDIDIIIEQKYPDLFLLGKIKIELEEKFKRHVDIIRIRKSLNPFLKKRIERDTIYV